MSQQPGKTEPVAKPRTRWASSSGRPPTEAEMLKRAVVGVAVLTQPLAAALTVLLAVVLTRTALMKRVRGWWVVLAGVAATGLALPLKALRGYLAPWRELAGSAADAVPSAGLGAAPDQTTAPAGVGVASLAHLLTDRAGAWVLAQLPFALCLALLAAGVVMARRQRFAADWQEAAERGPRDAWQEWEAMSPRQRARIEARGRKAMAASTVDAAKGFQGAVMHLGLSTDGEEATLSGNALNDHTVVTGPSGRGKTTTLLRLAYGFLVEWRALRLPLVMFDFKADPVVVRVLRMMAALTGRRMHLVSVTDPRSTTYDPLLTGNREQVVSRLMDMLANSADGGFSEPHHRNVGELWLLVCMGTLDQLAASGQPFDGRVSGRPWQRSLHDLAQVMDLEVMSKVRSVLTGELSARVDSELGKFAADSGLAASAAGMQTRIALLAATSAGRVLTSAPGGVNLAEAIEAGDVVLFSLSSASDKRGAQVVGNLALADLGAQFDRLLNTDWARRTGLRVPVILDEFGGLGGSLLESLLQRARGGGGAIILSAQTAGTFEEVSPAFAESVWSNSNVWILHAQRGDAAAERAEAIGTEAGLSETVQVQEDADALGSMHVASGVGSLRRVERFVVHPNELKQLQRGEIVVHTGVPHRTQRVRPTPVDGWLDGAAADLPGDDDVAVTAPEAPAAPAAAVEPAASSPDQETAAWAVLDFDQLQDWAQMPSGAPGQDSQDTDNVSDSPTSRVGAQRRNAPPKNTQTRKKAATSSRSHSPTRSTPVKKKPVKTTVPVAQDDDPLWGLSPDLTSDHDPTW